MAAGPAAAAGDQSCEGLPFSPIFFYLPEDCHSLHQALNPEGFYFPPSPRGFLSSLIFPVYSTCPLLVILEPRWPGRCTAEEISLS